MNGWIKLHRKIAEKGFYKKPAYLSLWIHLLLLANHDTHEFVWNGSAKQIKKGQLLTGRKQLSEDTGIPESSVERILEFFEKERQIGQQKTTKYRLITILNWHQYQISDNRRTTDGQQTDTYKNEKNYKNTTSEQSSPEDMSGWNRKSDDYDQEMVVNLETGEVTSPLEEQKLKDKQLRESIKNNLLLIEQQRGLKYNQKSLNADIKIYQQLCLAGWSDERIVNEYLDLIGSEYWQNERKNGNFQE